MSSLIQSLKFEVARVTRKEIKDTLLAIRKTTTTQRTEIAILKRQVKILAAELKAGTRVYRMKSAPTSTLIAHSRVRFSAERFAAWRTKVGITQAQTALLLQASPLSVFKWESDKTKPRVAQLQRIAAVMKMGKREVHKKLQDIV